MILFYFILIVFIFFISCKKDEPCSIKDDCIEIPDSQSPFGYNYEYDTNYLGASCFNPNNENEILFVKISYSLPYTSVLYKYNLQTKSKELLLSNVIYSQPCWTRNNWILLGLEDSNIWKIKSNGDSLTNIATGGSNLYPDWNNDNTKVIYTYSLNAGVPYFIVSKNIITNYVDTIFNGFSCLNSISSQNYLSSTISYRDFANISYSDNLNNISWTTLTNIDSHGFKRVEGISWHQNNEDIYYTRILEGIFKININDKKEVQIKNACDTRKYSAISVSPKGDKIIVERIDGYISDDNKLYNDSKLFLMNIDGCNEQEIVIE